MRVKKQKRHRRTVKFFQACFGFRQPFKILCDGTFVHHLIANGIAPADKALSNILGGPVKLFTSRCVLGELKRLGNLYLKSLEAANQLIIARCDHEKVKGADACVVDIIGEENLDHFFLATQDADLRKRFREVPGIPLIFALRNALLVEPPSEFQVQFVKSSEAKRLHVTKMEQKMLNKRITHLLEDMQVKEPAYENEKLVDQGMTVASDLKKHARKETSVKDRSQFKRKKAKGPNPLSVMKKKNRESPNVSSMKETNSDKGSVRSRRRKRNRSGKGNKSAETDG